MTEQKYKCNHCDYITNRTNNLKRHQNTVHKLLNEKLLNEKMLNETEKMLNENEKMLNENEKMLNDNYICKKCNKSYKTKKSFINHDEKCNGLSILTCPKCMITFSSRFCKSSHMKRNNCTAKSIIHYNKENNNNIVINNNIINNNIVNNNNIVINNYGSERKDYITFEDIMNILLKGGNSIVPRYIELKHFNDNFPENKNIKYEKNNKCLIREKGEWKYTNIEQLSNKLIKKNSYELSEYYNNKKNNIEERIKDINLIEFIYSRLNYLDLSINKNIYKDIKNEIKNIIKSTLLI
jgi:uncharacterized C2H2 Zn-finger protein